MNAPQVCQNPQERRYKVLYLSHDFPLQMVLLEAYHPGDLAIRYKFTTNTIPDNVQAVKSFFDMRRNSVAYLLYHESWPIVDEGGEYPEIMPKELNLDVVQITESTNILPYATVPVSDWRKLPGML